MKKTLTAMIACFGILATAAFADIAQVGKPAPQFIAPYATGGTFKFSSLRRKPVYLNFYATWCPPCNEEAPDVNSLQQKYRKRGLVVLAVDERENAQKAQSFIIGHRLSYRAVVDPSGDILAPYGAIGLPVHVFIDRRGNVKLIRNGEMSRKEIEDAIRSIL